MWEAKVNILLLPSLTSNLDLSCAFVFILICFHLSPKDVSTHSNELMHPPQNTLAEGNTNVTFRKIHTAVYLKSFRCLN